MNEEFDKWKEKIGLIYLIRPESDPLKLALQVSENIVDYSPEDIDRAVLVLTNYYSFLCDQLGSIRAKVKYGNDKISYNIDLVAAKYNASSASERRAIALSKNEDVLAFKKLVDQEEYKLNALEPIVDSIRIKIYALQKIYDRRIRSMNVN